jgi:beta-glucanase (GH16 family)
MVPFEESYRNIKKSIIIIDSAFLFIYSYNFHNENDIVWYNYLRIIVLKERQYMKKIVGILLLLLVSLTLVACDEEDVRTNPVTNCIPGYNLEDGECVYQVTEDDCDIDEMVVDNECIEDPNYVPIVNDDLVGPVYQSQGYDYYAGRDIVADECSYLDNIGEWQPVWCDEFDYEGLPNSTLWNYDVGGHGWGNNELQYYTNADVDNAYVANGYLTIEAMKESFGGNDYTSARLVSRDKGDWTYGKVQVRAKVAGGKGTWPAIWMLPTDWSYGGWPDSGEIDIMEFVGVDPNLLHATIHTGAYNHSIGTQVGETISLNNMETEFHVYEMEWEPNVIRFYVNGINYYTVNYDPDNSSNVLPWEAWPFDEDFHLILNLAFGGNWGGYAGIDESLDHMKFEIDYVRVYQKDYAGMDNEVPEAVTDLRIISSSPTQSFVGWDVAVDDVMIEYYEVYIDNVLLDNSTHNAIVIDAGATDQIVKVIPVDFAGNKGPAQTITVGSYSAPTQNDRIEAEAYTFAYGIQTEVTTDTGGGLNVGYIDTGDYMNYEIEITEAGNYQIKARVASLSNGGSFYVIQDSTIIGDCTFSATGGWQNWQDGYSTIFYLDPGTYTFSFQATNSGWNVNYFEFLKTD